MAKIGTKRWHLDQIDRIEEMKSKAGKKGAAARIKNNYNYKKGTEHNLITPKKQPTTRYNTKVDYDFLKYVRVVFKWATENHELTRPQIETLLYLYSLGAFSQRQFIDFHKIVAMYPMKSMKKYVEEGWISLWRPAIPKEKIHRLYSLTQKGKKLCNDMHKFSMGLEPIPVKETANKLALKDSGKRINTYYMDMIKKMNKDKNKEAPE